MSCVKCGLNNDLELYTHHSVHGWASGGRRRIKVTTITRTLEGMVCPDCKNQFKVYKKIDSRSMWGIILSLGIILPLGITWAFVLTSLRDDSLIGLATYVIVTSSITGVCSLIIYYVNRFSKKNPDPYFGIPKSAFSKTKK
ncbi:hypothetical protein LCGC14_1437720 [marine sediment metagenome]|uniref:Uncharacterized protein n=1 Tax=marine sediment metagenome TaxID=412755 RepID=A0A0F9K7T1_9ZZZZ|nr:hypothetical protein [bacterium]